MKDKFWWGIDVKEGFMQNLAYILNVHGYDQK